MFLKSPIFQDITPCRLLKVNRSFGGTFRLHCRRINKARNTNEAELCLLPASCWCLAEDGGYMFLLRVRRFSADCTKLYPAVSATRFMLVSCLAYSSTVKIEATCSSETSVEFHRTTRRYIPEDRTLHNHCCEYLKSYNMFLISLSVFSGD
jgi:hypothetical protein